MNANTDQTDIKRDNLGRFAIGNKPANGFDKNPNNIAPGGYWRYKMNGKSAIIDIFKMSVNDFNSLGEIDDNNKTVLDEVLFAKFKSAIAGHSKDAEYLLNQLLNNAQCAEKGCIRPYEGLTAEELRILLKKT